jgi:hypothetical protein
MTDEATDLVQAVVSALEGAGYRTIMDPSADGHGASVGIMESNSDVEFLKMDISSAEGTTLRVHHDGEVHRIHADGRAASDVRRVIARLIAGVDAIARLPTTTIESGRDIRDQQEIGDPIPTTVASTLTWVLIESIQSAAENYRGYPTEQAQEAIAHIDQIIEAGTFLKGQIGESEAVDLQTELDRIGHVRHDLQDDLDQSRRPNQPTFTR